MHKNVAVVVLYDLLHEEIAKQSTISVRSYRILAQIAFKSVVDQGGLFLQTQRSQPPARAHELLQGTALPRASEWAALLGGTWTIS